MTRSMLIDSEESRLRAVAILQSIPITQTLELTIGPYRENRTHAQNRRYWLLMGLLATTTGHDKDELHDWCKEKFLGTRIIEIAGERRHVSPSTRRLKVDEFAIYMTKIETWMIETLGVWLE